MSIFIVKCNRLHYNKNMKNEVNLVNFDNNMPLNISIINFDTIFRHNHTQPQLILFLEGECDVYIENQVFHAKENDMVLINKNLFHHLISEKGCTAISTIIDVPKFIGPNEKEDFFFKLNTMDIKENPRYSTMRYLVYSLISYNSMENINSIYTNRAISYSFFAQLVNDFRVTTSLSSQNKENISLINTLSAYINDHYKENISLNDLASTFSYSPAYLSRLFKSTLNETFIEYYDKLRVNYSLNDLLLNNKTIEDISKENGFDDVRSYVRAFKNINNLTPSEYRQKYKNKSSSFINIDKKLLRKQTLDKIIASREIQTRDANKENKPRETEVFLECDLKDKTYKMNDASKTILEINGPSDLTNELIIENIKKAKQDFGLTYIKVPHLLGRETHLLRKNYNDEWTINFVIFSQFINKILSLGAIPYLVFEYNEKILNRTEFFTLVLSLLQYMSSYLMTNLNEVLISFSFYRDNETYINPASEEYFYLYQDLYLETRKRLIAAKIGTPFFYKNDILTKKDYFKFIELCQENELHFDFVPIKYTYNFYMEEELSKNKNEMKDFLTFLKNRNGYFQNRMFIEGINFTSSSNNLLNDTIYDSSYLIYNFIENVNDFSSYSKNSFMDRDSISAYDPNPFHGENGMLTYNNIKKASYNAFVFLGKLEKNILKKGDGYIVTISKNKIVILLNNYSHYSDLYADKEYYQISNLSRYDCFAKSTNVNYEIKIKSIVGNNARIKISSISKTSGSSYDIWLKAGGIKNLNSEEIETLKNISDLSFEITNKEIINNSISILLNVAPLESKLIEIEINK